MIIASRLKSGLHQLIERLNNNFLDREFFLPDSDQVSFFEISCAGDKNLLLKKALRLQKLCELFLDNFGDSEVFIWRAPARINILGEHIDYVSYLPTSSLTFGSREHEMVMLYRPTQKKNVRGTSTLESSKPFDFAFRSEISESGTDADIEQKWLDFLRQNPVSSPSWMNYVKGAVFYAQVKYGAQINCGFDFAIDSSIPAGAGASSSSALTVLAGAAIRNVNRVDFTGRELATDSSIAEWFIGTRGGAMDHLTICQAQAQALVHISYRENSARNIPFPQTDLRWLTFFTSPAEKNSTVMLEYNERAAISRIIIPAIIKTWQNNHPDIYQIWKNFSFSVKQVNEESLSTIEAVFSEHLPETIVFKELEISEPELFDECRLSFPALVREKFNAPLTVRARALFHLGEIRRVAQAISFLSIAENNNRVFEREKFGALIRQTHRDLCQLYEVCTPEISELVKIISADKDTYGARLMGAGFGGNVLAVTTVENVSSLIDRVQSEFYTPRGRDATTEEAIMINSPGVGLSLLNFTNAARAELKRLNKKILMDENDRRKLNSVLDDSIPENSFKIKIAPIVVAAGKGTRAAESGLFVPKPLALISNVSAITRVVQNLKSALETKESTIVIVSAESEKFVRQELSETEFIFVRQQLARGTGDAILAAIDILKDFDGRSLIVWSTQPVIQPETIRRTIQIAHLFPEYKMILPTTLKPCPYAPITRNKFGEIENAGETHLEKAAKINFGETNIGLFLIDNQSMIAALRRLKKNYWLENENRYHKPNGELGFPNEMINHFSAEPNGVLAVPIADPREEQGIKIKDDVARCEKFIAELERGKISSEKLSVKN